MRLVSVWCNFDLRLFLFVLAQERVKWILVNISWAQIYCSRGWGFFWADENVIKSVLHYNV